MIFGAVLGFAGTYFTTRQDGPMTIDEAVRIAERNAFAVRLQNTTLERDRQAIALALSALGPTFGFTTNLSQNGQATYVSFGPGTAPVVTSPFQTGTSGLGISLPIDLAGNLNRLVAASRSTYEAARRTLEASFNDARLNARSAYITVLRDTALVVVAKEAVKDAQDRLNQARLELAQKQIAKVDVDRLDAQLAQATSDLLNANNTLELAKNSFNQTLARPIESPVFLVELQQAPAIPPNVDELTKRAQSERPEARSLVDQIKALAYIRRAQEAGLNPSMTLGLNYSRNLNATFLSGNPNTVTATLGLNVPIFDSGATRARVREARQDETSAKIQLQQTQLSISQDVRSAVTNMVSAEARLNNAQRQLALAQEVFRLAQVRQEAGEGTYIDVVDAESSLEQARNGVVSAKYDYLLAYSQLQHGVGNDQVQQPASAQPTPSPGEIK